MIDLRKAAPLAGLALALGCGGGSADKLAAGSRRFELNFAARVADAGFACGRSYMLGTPATPVEPNDFKLYIYDVALVRADGSKVPVALDTDGKWQTNDVALLDFEDNTGTCKGGTPETNAKLVGTVVDNTDYTGLHFRIGVPTELNHLSYASQPAPLDDVSMFWSWQDGHILLANEWTTPINSGWQFRLAESTYESDDGCKGSHATGYTCPNSFQPIVELTHFDDRKDTVKLDLAPLYQEIDFTRTSWTPGDKLATGDAAQNALIDYQPGCHSDEWDAECVVLFAALGIDYLQRGMPDPTKQTFVSKL
ncbi:MAG: hypothetical protein JWN04_1355 [Myxococcaceae bacterium]|nr:hypothetical protein [Myxococcaceae bacterium]